MKLLGSAVTAGKMSNRVGRRWISLLVEEEETWQGAMVVRMVKSIAKMLTMLVMMVKSSARMVDLSPVQPGVPNSITSGDSPPLMENHIRFVTLYSSFHNNNIPQQHFLDQEGSVKMTLESKSTERIARLL